MSGCVKCPLCRAAVNFHDVKTSPQSTVFPLNHLSVCCYMGAAMETMPDFVLHHVLVLLKFIPAHALRVQIKTKILPSLSNEEFVKGRICKMQNMQRHKVMAQAGMARRLLIMKLKGQRGNVDGGLIEVTSGDAEAQL